MKFILIIFTLTLSSIASASCLNISGTYEMDNAGGMPDCASGVRVVKAWKKYQQEECKALTYSKVYKLANGTLCESSEVKSIIDGKERQAGNPEYLYKIDAYADRQVLTLNAIADGRITTSTKTLDSSGNLIVDGSDGDHAVFIRGTVQ